MSTISDAKREADRELERRWSALPADEREEHLFREYLRRSSEHHSLPREWGCPERARFWREVKQDILRAQTSAGGTSCAR